MNTMTANRKPQGYLATVKRNLDEARRALAERTKSLAQAEATLERERGRLPPEPPRGQPLSESAAESLLERKRPFFEACDAARNLANEVSAIEREVQKLSGIVEAPQRIKESLAEYRKLAARRRELRAEADKNAKLQRDLEGRIAKAKAAGEAANRAAMSKMIESGNAGLPVPEAVSKASDEIRCAQEWLAGAEAKGRALSEELRTLPTRLRDARDDCRSYLGVIAETELQEALLPIMPVLARAQVARRALTLEIRIPREAIEAAEQALASEMAEEAE
jgi:DNA repair exonuclease SbcCD ATPase subunit